MIQSPLLITVFNNKSSEKKTKNTNLNNLNSKYTVDKAIIEDSYECTIYDQQKETEQIENFQKLFVSKEKNISKIIEFKFVESQILEFYTKLLLTDNIGIPEHFQDKFQLKMKNRNIKYDYKQVNLGTINTQHLMQQLKDQYKCYQRLSNQLEILYEKHFNLGNTDSLNESDFEQFQKLNSSFYKNYEEKQAVIPNLSAKNDDETIYKTLTTKKNLIKKLENKYTKYKSLHENIIQMQKQILSSQKSSFTSSTRDSISTTLDLPKKNQSVTKLNEFNMVEIKKLLIHLRDNRKHPKAIKEMFALLNDKHFEETHIKEILGSLYILQETINILKSEIEEIKFATENEEYFQSLISTLKGPFDTNYEIAEAISEKMDSFIKSKFERVQNKQKEINQTSVEILNKLHRQKNPTKITLTKDCFEQVLLVLQNNQLKISEVLKQRTLEFLKFDHLEKSYTHISINNFDLEYICFLNQDNFNILNNQFNNINSFQKELNKNIITYINLIEHRNSNILENNEYIEEYTSYLQKQDQINFSKTDSKIDENILHDFISSLKNNCFDNKIIHDIYQTGSNEEILAKLYILNTIGKENISLLQEQDRVLDTMRSISKDLQNIEKGQKINESSENVQYILDKSQHCLNFNEEQNFKKLNKFTKSLNNLNKLN